MSCGCGALTQLTPTVRTLAAKLSWRDVLGGWRVRWAIGRGRYRVAPGLYRIGQTDAQSPVLVTANYKLSVDAVRRHLAGLNVWLLVLDTKGVNVWCAAGKGTFGTAELVRSVRAVKLAELVKHRNLVLPELGAVGVAAHEVKKQTGFSVHYGPVRARDISAYLAAGMRATAAMRRVSFSWKDRLILTPTELVHAWPLLLGALVLAALVNLPSPARWAGDTLRLLGAVVTGAVVVPLLLPWLPSKAFSVKGAVAGAAWAAASAAFAPMRMVEAAGSVLLAAAAASYLAMNFTGSTTFTTYAGARLEVRRALPAILASAALGIVLRVTAVFV
jgi:hypothetical protein